MLCAPSPCPWKVYADKPGSEKPASHDNGWYQEENLSQAALETLAIIAYNPKITRAEIESIRGVNSDGTIYKLLEYNLIESAGKLDAPGKPTMYSTTSNFLKLFDLKSLEELPDLPKYKVDENEQIVIDDIVKGEEEWDYHKQD